MIDAADGSSLASQVHWYYKWKADLYCDPSKSQYRQHLSDHIEGLEITVKSILKEAGIKPSEVKGICVDTTGSSPLPLDRSAKPLCLTPEFCDNPNAMVILWKDHTAINEAEEINHLAHSWEGEDFTKYEGGIYSAEWFWAKILHISRTDESVKRVAHSWIEHCDYMTFLLIGEGHLNEFKRSRCASGHKAMWHSDWSGLPHDDFLKKLDPYLVEVKKNLYRETYTSDVEAGSLSKIWADKLGLTTKVKVAVGTFDAHAGAVGAEVKPGTLVRVMGTSTCDIIISPSREFNHVVRGICGQVDGSVIPNMIGFEAGQSSFGDTLAWFKSIMDWPIDNLLDIQPEQRDAIKSTIIHRLSEKASQIPISVHGPLALDWFNGRRTPDANQKLKAGIINLSLATEAPHLFKAIVESICYGSKAIVDRFTEEGIEINEVVGIGGVAKKSGFVMQTLADVLNMPIKVAVSEQAPALGAAMFASVASDIYPDLETAIQNMGQGFEKTYHPIPENVRQYKEMYGKYIAFGQFVEHQIESE